MEGGGFTTKVNSTIELQLAELEMTTNKVCEGETVLV